MRRRDLLACAAAFISTPAKAQFFSLPIGPGSIGSIGPSSNINIVIQSFFVTTSGNNANPGTLTLPWLTLQHADATAPAGSIVNVAAGTYVENDITNQCWSPGQVLTWVASGTVTVQGSGTATQALFLSGSNVISFSGFTFDGGGTRTNAAQLAAATSNKTFTNCTWQSISASGNLLLGAGAASNITINGGTLTYPSSTSHAINSGGMTNLLVSGATFMSTNSGNAYNGSASDVSLTIAGCTFNSITAGAVTLHSITTLTTSGTIAITNNNFNTSDLAIRCSGAISTFNISGNFFNCRNHSIFSTTTGGTVNVTNNTFTPTATGVVTPADIIQVASGNSNYNITGNTATTQAAYAFTGPLFGLSGTGVVNFSNNTITNNIGGVTGAGTAYLVLVKDATTPVVNSNTISNNDTTNGTALSGIGVQAINTTTTATIVGNTVANKSLNAACFAIQLGTDQTSSGDQKLNGSTITDNIVTGYNFYFPTNTVNVQTHGIEYGYNVNGIIARNYCNGLGYALVVKGQGVMNWTSGGAYYNKGINCKGFSSIRIKGVKGLLVANNTFYWDLTTGFTGSQCHISTGDDDVGNHTSNVTVENNIMYQVGTASGGISIDALESLTAAVSGYVSKNNGYFRTAGTNIGNNVGTLDNYAAWQTAGFAVSSFNSDPLFNNIGTLDFTVQSGSPAKAAGAATTFTTDFANNSVTQPPTIGAYQ